MAWRNIWRNPRRSILTMAAIAFACLLLVFMLSFQLGTYDTMINVTVRVQTGHLQVQAQGYREKPSIRKVISDPAAVDRIIDGTPGVEGHTFRAESFSLVSAGDRTHGALVVGIDPARERRVSTLAKLIRKGRFLEPGDGPRAMVGRLLAQNLQVGVGDELTLLGQGRDGSVAATVLTVTGIFGSGQDELDRSLVHIPLTYFQEVFFMRGAVHRAVIVAESLGRVAGIEKRLTEKIGRLDSKQPLAVLDWDELMPGLYQAITIDLVAGLIFWFLLIIVVAFSILNTFLMAIFERTREFGVLMALGTRPGRITRLLLTESLFLTLTGVASGILLGCLVTLFFESYGIGLGGASELVKQFGLSDRLYPKLSWITVLLGPSLVLIITLLAALYPAFKVRRLSPVEAMGHV